jgi:hypothetical protein
VGVVAVDAVLQLKRKPLSLLPLPLPSILPNPKKQFLPLKVVQLGHSARTHDLIKHFSLLLFAHRAAYFRFFKICLEIPPNDLFNFLTKILTRIINTHPNPLWTLKQ